MKKSRSRLAPCSTLYFAWMLLLGPRFAGAADVVAVTTCGQFITAGRMAELTADLDCSSSATPFIELEHRVTLRLMGHVLTGSVNCTNSCFVEGPGTIDQGAVDAQWNANITGATIIGSVISKQKGAKITDSTITGTTNESPSSSGVSVKKRARITNSTISGHPSNGVWAARAVIIDSAITNNGGEGVVVVGNAAKVIGSTVTGNGRMGIETPYGTARVIGSTVSDNVLQGIEAYRPRIKDSIISNNGSDGVLSDGASVVVKNSTITGNGGLGVRSFHFRAKIVGTSSVENNCTTLSPCADVGSRLRPVVRPPATCGTSWDGKASSWGVCTLD